MKLLEHTMPAVRSIFNKKNVKINVIRKVRVNTFCVNDDKPFIDVQSKIFIIAQAIAGINRLALFSDLRKVVLYIEFVYSIFTISALICNLLLGDSQIETVLVAVQHIFGAIFGFISYRRLRNYYLELAKFDREVGCRPRISFSICGKITANALTVFFIGILYYLSNKLDVIVVNLPVAVACMHMVQFTEIYYYGHLLDLMLPRIQLINYYVESPLTLTHSRKQKLKDYVFFSKQKRNDDLKMKQIMDLYQIVVSAFDLLVHAIKWQVLIIITLSFVTTLIFSFKVTLKLIHGTRNIIGALANIGILAAFLVTLVAPCSSSDRLHRQALRLRELLATRLYDNRLDKWSRSVARALLALTESRDLSFSLMNMFNVDVSLPFTFTSLLITYLIILLQFDKVINN